MYYVPTRRMQYIASDMCLTSFYKLPIYYLPISLSLCPYPKLLLSCSTAFLKPYRHRSLSDHRTCVAEKGSGRGLSDCLSVSD